MFNSHKKNSIFIAGMGKYLPSNIVYSKDLDSKLNKAPGWVAKKSGVNKRHFANNKETTSYMAAAAAKEALENANIVSSDVDCIISACGVPHQAIPATGALIQQQLGLGGSGIPAFDINCTCLSFIVALDIASFFISNHKYKNILLVTSDIASIGLNWNDPETCTIFGDGAAAVVISTNNNNSTILSSRLETYSDGHTFCQIRGGGTALHPRIANTDNYTSHMLFEMDGKSLIRFVSSKIQQITQKVLADAKLTIDDIDLVIPHQASKLANIFIHKHLGISKNKIMDIYSEHGNQIATSIPTAFYEAIKRSKIKKKDKILFLGTSAGVSLGAMIMEF